MFLLTTKPVDLHLLVLHNSIISLLLNFHCLPPPPPTTFSIVLLHGRIKSGGVSFTTLPFSNHNGQPVSSMKRPICLGMYIINVQPLTLQTFAPLNKFIDIRETCSDYFHPRNVLSM